MKKKFNPFNMNRNHPHCSKPCFRERFENCKTCGDWYCEEHGENGLCYDCEKIK